MRSLTKTIGIFLVLFASQNLFAQSGWQWVNPLPTGNDYNQVKFLNSKTGFAVGWARAVSKTTNGGLNWVLKNSGVNFAIMNCVSIIDSANIVVAGNGIYKSSNGGENWVQISTQGAEDVLFINVLTGFIAQNQSFIKKTTDGGITWAGASYPGTFWNGLVFINSQTGFASGTLGINKTTNQGTNWIQIFDFPTTNYIKSINFINSLTGFAFLRQETSLIIKTTNGGDNWFSYKKVTFSSVGTTDNFKVLTDSLFYLSRDNGLVHKSTNSGTSWTAYSAPGLLTSISFPSKDTGYVVGVGGVIYRTTNFGSNWICQSSPYGNLAALNYICFPDQNTGYAVGNSEFFKTTNTGVTWQYTPMPNYDFNTAHFINSETGFSVGAVNSLIKTNNGGTNWVTIRGTFPKIVQSINFLNESTGFVSLYGGYVFRTTNSGVLWDSITLGTNSSYSLVNSINFLDLTTGYVLVNVSFSPFLKYSEIYITTNTGLNWSRVSRFDGLLSNSMKFVSIDTGYFTSGISNDNSIYKTVNGGVNWTKIFNKGGRCINTLGSNTVYVAGYKSTNAGLNWFSQDVLFQGDYYDNSIVYINQNTGFLVCGYGASIIKTTDGGGIISAVNPISSQIPKQFSLSQNYPNPFNPSTKINYEVKSSGFVSLKVFDLLGKEVATLINEKQNAGSYAVDFNSAEFNLPSGIYFYTLNAGEFKETRKMVLVK